MDVLLITPLPFLLCLESPGVCMYVTQQLPSLGWLAPLGSFLQLSCD